MTIHDWKNEEAVLAALYVASEKWGALTLTGTAAFKAEAVQLAAEHGYNIVNPELQDQLAAAREHIARQVGPAPTAPLSEATAETQAAAPPAPVQGEPTLKTPGESALALEQNRLAIEREASLETRQANAAGGEG